MNGNIITGGQGGSSSSSSSLLSAGFGLGLGVPLGGTSRPPPAGVNGPAAGHNLGIPAEQFAAAKEKRSDAFMRCMKSFYASFAAKAK